MGEFVGKNAFKFIGIEHLKNPRGNCHHSVFGVSACSKSVWLGRVHEKDPWHRNREAISQIPHDSVYVREFLLSDRASSGRSQSQLVTEEIGTEVQSYG